MTRFRGRTGFGILVLVASITVGGLTIMAQNPATGFKGEVMSIVEGSPIVGAQVIYRHPTASVSGQVETDENGAFEVTGVPPGTYIITILADGYNPRRELPVTVVTGAISPIDIKLRAEGQLENPGPAYRIVDIDTDELDAARLDAILNSSINEGYVFEQAVPGADGKTLLVFSNIILKARLNTVAGAAGNR